MRTNSPSAARVQKKVDDLISFISKIYAEDGEESSELIESEKRQFDEDVVCISLQAIQKTIRVLHAQAKLKDAYDETTAIEGAGGARYFAVPTQMMEEDGKSFIALATVSGEDRFVTVVQDSVGNAAREETVRIARWKPSLPDSILENLKDLPQCADSLEEEEILAAANKLSGYSWADSDFSLEGALKAKRNSSSHVASMTSKSHRIPAPNMLINRNTHVTDIASWYRYAEIFRPAVFANSSPEISEQTFIRSFAAEVGVVADGGFCGDICQEASQRLRSGLAEIRFRGSANALSKLADDTIAAGYVWREKWLKYGDLDRYTFAVASPDGLRIGRYHRNIDLICKHDSHMVVVDRNPDGNVKRIEIHLAYIPSRAIKEWDPDLSSSELALSIADRVTLYADEKAVPPRLTSAMLADRIARGEELPEPIAGFDFVTGQLLPGTADDTLLAVRNMFYGMRADRDAMDQVANEKELICGWEESTVFDEDYEEEVSPEAPTP